MSIKVTGIQASSGIAIAKAFILEKPIMEINRRDITEIDEEIDRFQGAVEKAKAELTTIKERTEKELGADKAAIFSAHLLVLSDPEFIGTIKEKIKNERVNGESATEEVSSMFISMFESMDNEYIKERAADIRDVSNRVLAHLIGVQYTSIISIHEEVVIIAEDLTPSDTAQLDRNFVVGFATDIGGRTSHSVIMARSMEIPAVVGTKSITKMITADSIIILDGIEGIIIIDPDDNELKTYKKKKEEYEAQRLEQTKLADEKTMTADGYHVELAANIGNLDDLNGALKSGAEGIGLYRTEFLYMGRKELPSEQEQFESYKTVLVKMKNKPVVIRTLDIGGDKELSYLNLPRELNPFLGLRAIRLCFDKQDIFRTQLRAILRASVYGKLKIMFPMIAMLEEFRQAKDILLEEKQKLVNEGIEVSDTIEIGMMVEIPATALMADQFAKEVDFFSIGTNDLIQYLMAVDRMNEKVSYLYQPYHPALLRLIHMVVGAAHKEGKWVGLCGEMAGDETALPLLLGLGIDEFSMSSTSILPARNKLQKISKQEAVSYLDIILNFDTAAQVIKFVKGKFK